MGAYNNAFLGVRQVASVESNFSLCIPALIGHARHTGDAEWIESKTVVKSTEGSDTDPLVDNPRQGLWGVPVMGIIIEAPMSVTAVAEEIRLIEEHADLPNRQF